jgi:hypothetical protein
VVGLDQDAVGLDLGGLVAVADVPGEAGQFVRRGKDLEERLGGGADGDAAAVGGLEGVAVVEGDGLGEVDQQGLAGVGGEGAAAEEAGLVVEGEAVGGPLGAASQDGAGGGAGHGFLRVVRGPGRAIQRFGKVSGGKGLRGSLVYSMRSFCVVLS